MYNSISFGVMVVFAVSGSIVLLVDQVHKHIFSNFMKQFEFEMGGVAYKHGKKKLDGTISNLCKKHHANKKVRFDKKVLEFSLENKGYNRNVTRAQKVMKNIQKCKSGPKLEDTMPPNRAVLYREIMKYRTIRGRLRP
ncbi:PREDICTED: uncharacterized protein LOC109347100 [Lupinus angustifolius]|uniref:uncharacterized protein LOC109347100 n=1 Tax=Lupinus angustifolius TaxID=3871 RepID=UPI00092E2364|nr:PREDICTED: uncharacterized protein LOC109347100 [Lupinus angustifolius]